MAIILMTILGCLVGFGCGILHCKAEAIKRKRSNARIWKQRIGENRAKYK